MTEVDKPLSQIRRLRVPTDKAATMFFLNLQTWKTQPFIQINYSSSMIDQLENNLRALTKTRGREKEIEWELRQIAFERV